jgi:hypothetical protein
LGLEALTTGGEIPRLEWESGDGYTQGLRVTDRPYSSLAIDFVKG